MVLRYRVAGATQYLAITGCYIKDVKLAKKAWILPGQKCTVFDVSPVNYTFEVQAMSAEKLPILLLTVFTIGPRIHQQESLIKYAKLLSSDDKHSSYARDLVQGVIEGETRQLVASMNMEEILKASKSFKQEVFTKGQVALNQLGLLIYNGNFKQLIDVEQANWQLYRKQKEADAALYEKEKMAKGQREAAKAAFFARQQEAEAKLYAKKKEAEGLIALAEARGVHFKALIDAFGGNHQALRDHVMIDRRIYQDMARINAEAIQGLQPKINMWITGSTSGEAAGEGGSGLKTLLADASISMQDREGADNS